MKISIQSIPSKVFAFFFISWTTVAGAATHAPVYGEKGLVATTSPLASEIGAEVLRKGGTAADAAVAVGFALAVAWPAAGNIGGGGFALVHSPGAPDTFLDFRETAPKAAGPNFYVDAKGQFQSEEPRIGYRAVGVPGTVSGLFYLHKKLGKLPWSDLIEPARKLAKDGFAVDAALEESFRRGEKVLSRFEETRAIFFKNGKLLHRGDKLVQKDLAASLALIQKNGEKGFYQGPVAQKIADAMKLNGGVMTPGDLSGYKTVEREPLKRPWRGYEIVTAPPPSSGGTVMLAMLGILEKDKLETYGYGSADYLHLLIEAMKKAYADRSHWFGDPGFVQNPVAELLDPKYLAKRRAEISETKAAHDVKPGEIVNEKPDTTHFTIRDRNGMVVSSTYTLNGLFGSGVVPKGTGILLNNEMDDFTSKLGEKNMFGLTQGEKNMIAPGKRPLSSMTPTFVYQSNNLIMALGAPGGPTITNSVTQVILHHLLFGMNIQQAVDAPRIHHQWLPDVVHYEPYGINPDTRRILEARGHIFNDEPRFFGDVQAIAWDAENKRWTGASDSRYGGVVVYE